jgi:hypothetical protein
MFNLLELSSYEFLQFLAVFFIAITAFYFLAYIRNSRKLAKKTKGRTSVSFTVKKLKKKERMQIFSNLAFTFTLLFALYALHFQYQYYNNRASVYSSLVSNYEKLIQLKNEQTEAISTDCMNIIQNSEMKMEDIENLVQDIRLNYDSLQEKYADCQEKLDNMPFLEAVKPFVENHTYDSHFFNCVDFSLGAVNILKDEGYNAFMRSVKVNCSSGRFGCKEGDNNRHAIVIVELPLEVTGTVMPITPEEFSDYGLK